MRDRTLISLNDRQLTIVMDAARCLDHEKRSTFLERVAGLLRLQRIFAEGAAPLSWLEHQVNEKADCYQLKQDRYCEASAYQAMQVEIDPLRFDHFSMYLMQQVFAAELVGVIAQLTKLLLKLVIPRKPPDVFTTV
jgi:hypothetical protein